MPKCSASMTISASHLRWIGFWKASTDCVRSAKNKGRQVENSDDFLAMPRFVVLEHDYPQLHWDLMLESGNVLRTWRLAAPPGKGAAIRAWYLAEHRKMYLDYEGPVSGNRGRVSRWDSGVYSWSENREDRVSVM